MAKRMTDSELWKKQRWFRKLSPIYKLCFCYIKDQCDHAGIWKIDCSDLVEDLGIEEFDLEAFIGDVNTEYDKITGKKIAKERLMKVGNSSLWITGFVQFQYQGRDGKVNPKAKAVYSALQRLDGLGLVQDGESQIIKGFQTLLNLSEPFVRVKDKDKDKDSISSTKKIENEKNAKQFRNPKAQGEYLFADRVANRDKKSDTD
jgi:hypothetical protein